MGLEELKELVLANLGVLKYLKIGTNCGLAYGAAHR